MWMLQTHFSQIIKTINREGLFTDDVMLSSINHYCGVLHTVFVVGTSWPGGTCSHGLLVLLSSLVPESKNMHVRVSDGSNVNVSLNDCLCLPLTLWQLRCHYEREGCKLSIYFVLFLI